MPYPKPATQRKLPPQNPVRPSSIHSASLTNFDTPIALARKSVGRGWLQALLPGFGSLRGRISNIRKSMLDELGQVATRPLHEEALARMIMQAQDAEALWELRDALDQAIGTVHGELVARQKMTEISFMFAGLLRRRHTEPDQLSGENVVRLPKRGPQPGLTS